MLTDYTALEEIEKIRTSPNERGDDEIAFLKKIITGDIKFTSRANAERLLLELVSLAASPQGARVSGYVEQALEKIKAEEEERTAEGRLKDDGNSDKASPAMRDADDDDNITGDFDDAADDADLPKTRRLSTMLLAIAQTAPGASVRAKALTIFEDVAERTGEPMTPGEAGTLTLLTADPNPGVQEAARHAIGKLAPPDPEHPAPHQDHKKEKTLVEN